MVRIRAQMLEKIDIREPTRKGMAAEDPRSVRKKRSRKAMMTSIMQKRYSSLRKASAA